MTKRYLPTRLGHIIKKLRRVVQNSIYKVKNLWLDVKSQKLKSEINVLSNSQSLLLMKLQKVYLFGQCY
jgi:hypothetical protein